MIFTLLHHLSLYLFNTIPLSFFLTSQCTRMSHTCSIFISLLILLPRDIQSNPGPVSCVSCLNMCTLNIRSFTNPFLYRLPLLLTQLILKTLMSLLLLKLGCLLTLHLLINLMLFLVDSPSLTHLVLFPIHSLLQSLVAAQHFFSVNLANFSPHLLLLLNLLNCLQSQSSFLTLIWRYIT